MALATQDAAAALRLRETAHPWEKKKEGVKEDARCREGDVSQRRATSPSVLSCLPAYASVNVLGGAAEGGAYGPTEASPASVPATYKMDGSAFHADNFLLEAKPSSFYGEKVRVGSHGQLMVMEQNWSNMALELHNLEGKNSSSSSSSSSSYPPPLPSPPTSASSSPHEETIPPLPQGEQHSTFPTLPRHTPLSTLAPVEVAVDEENTSPCMVPHDDFTVVTQAEMHQPPTAAARDIRKPSRASKSSGVRARPDDLAVSDGIELNTCTPRPANTFRWVEKNTVVLLAPVYHQDIPIFVNTETPRAVRQAATRYGLWYPVTTVRSNLAPVLGSSLREVKVSLDFSVVLLNLLKKATLLSLSFNCSIVQLTVHLLGFGLLSLPEALQFLLSLFQNTLYPTKQDKPLPITSQRSHGNYSDRSTAI
ncbi:hypothetical protein FQN60_006622 [Etheostoma spectabile]|uniref:Uncharacterized protein n=1 Tax=Etheostoma spectabile TaxID=54343 RepID=A0A5J5CGI7_9PERO|nr:hypothetical protein FQN60_006622 [Etheostoma spectabile]